jgi:hypothetical protein
MPIKIAKPCRSDQNRSLGQESRFGCVGAVKKQETREAGGLHSKFETGQVVVTPAASAALQSHGHSVADLLARHQAGDWGDVSDQLRDINARGLTEQFNLQSVYAVGDGQHIIVVTNRDRSLTMVHLDG